MDFRIETQVNRFGKWTRIFQRGTKEERPEHIRIADEIMPFLVKRETTLSDALDALAGAMLGALAFRYGERDEFLRFFKQVNRFLASTERDRVVSKIPKQPGGVTAKVQPRTPVMDDKQRRERIGRLADEVGELVTKLRPKSLRVGIGALETVMVTAVEATCGRERADEFDLLLTEFDKEVISFPEVVVQ